MRAILTAILIVVVGFGLFWVLKPEAPSNVPSAQVGTSTPVATSTATVATSSRAATLSSFSFTGYGPGKEHVGTFKDWSVSGVTFDAAGVPAAGKFVIKTASVDTGIANLDKHLCNEDFFNCAANPEIVFDLKGIAAAPVPAGATPTVGANEFTVSGNLTFNGVTKAISFPVTVKTTSPASFAADFKFDTTFFNFKYTAIDKEVRIQFNGEVR